MEGEIMEEKMAGEWFGSECISSFIDILRAEEVAAVLECTLANRIEYLMSSYFDELEKSGALDRMVTTIQKLAEGSAGC